MKSALVEAISDRYPDIPVEACYVADVMYRKSEADLSRPFTVEEIVSFYGHMRKLRQEGHRDPAFMIADAFEAIFVPAYDASEFEAIGKIREWVMYPPKPRPSGN